MCNKLLVGIITSILLIINIWALVPASWINLAELEYAAIIRDILIIPQSNIISPCAQQSVYNWGNLEVNA